MAPGLPARPRGHAPGRLVHLSVQVQHDAIVMGKFKGRNSVACTACHRQKLKCPGGMLQLRPRTLPAFWAITNASSGIPCQRCHTRGRECVYLQKDKLITIPEGYLRELERELNQAYQPGSGAPATQTEPGPSSSKHQDHNGPNDTMAAKTKIRQDAGPETFVQLLKDLSTPDSIPLNPAITRHVPADSAYTYLRLNLDFERKYNNMARKEQQKKVF